MLRASNTQNYGHKEIDEEYNRSIVFKHEHVSSAIFKISIVVIYSTCGQFC